MHVARDLRSILLFGDVSKHAKLDFRRKALRGPRTSDAESCDFAFVTVYSLDCLSWCQACVRRRIDYFPTPPKPGTAEKAIG
jgi:hypothetical protein